MSQRLNWKLRRVVSGIRQHDLALRVGISTTRYSAIERGARVPSKLETELIDKFLPQLPVAALDLDRVEPCNGGARLLQAVGRQVRIC